MENIVIILVLAAILGGAIWYICRAKKRCVTCIGCPDSGTCGGNCSGCGGTAKHN